MDTSFLTSLALSILGGFIPAFIWMAFWLQEDHDHPEPLSKIFKAFTFGMVMVPIAFILQTFIHQFYLHDLPLGEIVSHSFWGGTILIFIWALIEESLKFTAAYFSGIHTKSADEPVDVLVYMIAAALGFAALENTLYILTPLLEGETTTALLTGNLRFIGATLLHVATSAIAGYSLALAFFRSKESRISHIFSGLFIATLLHSLFNLFIISTQATYMIWGLLLVWFGTLLLFFLFEKIKHVHLNKI